MNPSFLSKEEEPNVPRIFLHIWHVRIYKNIQWGEVTIICQIIFLIIFDCKKFVYGVQSDLTMDIYEQNST